jgi:hypothetical protein
MNTSTLPDQPAQCATAAPATDIGGTEAVDAVLGATAVAGGHRRFAARIAAAPRRRHPIDKFGLSELTGWLKN